MLIKLLPKLDKELLLNLTELLALSDNQVLWDGKKYDEITSNTNLDDLSIQIDEQENELITDLAQSAGLGRGYSLVEHRLVEQLKTFPLNKIELTETRIAASQAVLAQLLEERSTSRPESNPKYVSLPELMKARRSGIALHEERPSRPEDPKIMLFEMFLVALRDGTISSIEQELLKAFQRYYQLEDFIFDELLERAEALNAEVSKTIALVLE